ncbi:MAG: DNA-3-methyladenine glycosylase I [Candidatus Baltobacteraceae bacterium]
MKRCAWAANPLAIAYHDREWGVPVHEDPMHFELLTLEGAQAGLSWDLILRKRERYREVFANFDPARVARFSRARIEQLLLDPGIVRNRLKVESAVSNARAFLRVQSEFGTFDTYVWRFVDGKPVRRGGHGAAPAASTPLSDRLSHDLRKRGFRFTGTTICYSYMQAAGLVDDHAATCFKRRP